MRGSSDYLVTMRTGFALLIPLVLAACFSPSEDGSTEQATEPATSVTSDTALTDGTGTTTVTLTTGSGAGTTLGDDTEDTRGADSSTTTGSTSTSSSTESAGTSTTAGTTAASSESTESEVDPCGPEVPDEPIALYFAENDTEDATGQNNGTPSGGLEYSQGVHPSCLGFEFDGTDDQIEVGAPIGLPLGNAPRSIAFWVDVAAFEDNDEIIGWGIDEVMRKSAIGLRTVPTPTIFFWGFANDLSMTETLDTDVWMHVAFTFDGSVATLYLNGATAASVSMTLDTAASALRIGYGTGQFSGTLDVVAIYDRALTSAEVESLAGL